MCLALMLALAACGAESTDAGDSTQADDQSTAGAADTQADGSSGSGSGSGSGITLSAEPAEPVLNGDPAEGVDVDLTVLTGVMVYSEVYNMVQYPDAYMGLRIKVGGPFSSYHDDSTGKNYCYLYVKDAGACCAQGIEFRLTDDMVFPDDYPQPESSVTIIGEFDRYKEGDYTYWYLKDARIVE